MDDFFANAGMYKLLCGDAIEQLKTLPDKFVQCIVTSPAYWRQRDYGVAGQFGLEDTPEEFVAHLVATAAELWRVLRDDGLFFLNIGDSYAGSGGMGGQNQSKFEQGMIRMPRYSRKASYFKPKDIVPVSWLVGLALMQAGWYLRSRIIWQKHPHLVESVKDRPVKSYEYILMFSKSRTYYYDRVPLCSPMPRDTLERVVWLNPDNIPNPDTLVGTNISDVWTMSPASGRKKHFATFPLELPRRCIVAATPSTGFCPKCGKNQMPIVEHVGTANMKWGKGSRTATEARLQPGNKGMVTGDVKVYSFRGFAPACACGVPACPSVVLDPFCGIGTTGRAALMLNRRFVGIDLNPVYLDDARTELDTLLKPKG